jgi:hypothetical protein
VTEIRSYRRVFDLERRVYSVDRLRLNPSGVPVRGVVYFVAVVAGALACSSLPLLGGGLGLVPWYLRDLVLPALAATFMALIRVEGRTFHHAAYALVRFACARRRLLGGWRGCGRRRWHPHDVLALPDGSERGFRELRYTGPGAVLLGAPHERNDPVRRRRRGRWVPAAARTTLIVRPAPQERASSTPEVILLEPGATLRVRGAPDRRP